LVGEGIGVRSLGLSEVAACNYGIQWDITRVLAKEQQELNPIFQKTQLDLHYTKP